MNPSDEPAHWSLYRFGMYRLVLVATLQVERSAGEGKDRCAITAAPNSFSFAICDGASQSLFGGLWAQELARSCAKLAVLWNGELGIKNAIARAQHRHRPLIEDERGRRRYERDRGDYSTLLTGLLIDRTKSLALALYAVGDTAAFLFKPGADPEFACFPLASAADLGRPPALVPSDPVVQLERRVAVEHVGPDFLDEDTVLIAGSDLFALHVLAAREEGRLNGVLDAIADSVIGSLPLARDLARGATASARRYEPDDLTVMVACFFRPEEVAARFRDLFSCARGLLESQERELAAELLGEKLRALARVQWS